MHPDGAIAYVVYRALNRLPVRQRTHVPENLRPLRACRSRAVYGPAATQSMATPVSASGLATRVVPRGSLVEVLLVFLRLGFTSFGGPVAHLGYFRAEFVERRQWLDEAGYADIVALCQFLPGPASSQVAVTLGILRAGLFGSLAAWLGFTMPSAIALVAFGYGVDAWAISRVCRGCMD